MPSPVKIHWDCCLEPSIRTSVLSEFSWKFWHIWYLITMKQLWREAILLLPPNTINTSAQQWKEISFLWMMFLRSSTYIQKAIGPKIDLWGTPQVIWVTGHSFANCHRTLSTRLIGIKPTQYTICRTNPGSVKITWSMVSKAAIKSKRTRTGDLMESVFISKFARMNQDSFCAVLRAETFFLQKIKVAV